MEYQYDAGYDPPAPVIPITIFRPFGSRRDGRQLICLVDSGADEVWLPENQLQALGCLKVDETLVEYADRRQSRMPLYFVGIQIGDVVRDALEVIGGELESGALIGRRILNRWIMTLDGPNLTMRI